MTEREDNIFMAKLAEQAERYEDVIKSMYAIVTLETELTEDERNLLSLGYKNLIGGRRASWRVLSSLEHKDEDNANQKSMEIIKDYRLKIEIELKEICSDILNIIDKHLIPYTNTLETRVFLYKMKGDYYRYLAEVTKGPKLKEYSDYSLSAYKTASDIATKELPPMHPIRLGLALNFSVFYYEILNSPDRACRLAKAAFDDAIAEMDSLSEDVFKDSTLIMQLLRDNLTLWTADVQGDDETGEPKQVPSTQDPSN